MSLGKTYDAGKVSRWHSEPQLNRMLQTNADHSWGVATIIFAICKNPSMELIKHALFHDVGELQAGDLSSDFKKDHPKIAELHSVVEYTYMKENLKGVVELCDFGLSDLERLMFKFADTFEAVLFILKYHPDPSDVNGMAAAVEQLRKMSFDIETETGAADSFGMCDLYINPRLQKHSLPLITNTPF